MTASMGWLPRDSRCRRRCSSGTSDGIEGVAAASAARPRLGAGFAFFGTVRAAAEDRAAGRDARLPGGSGCAAHAGPGLSRLGVDGRDVAGDVRPQRVLVAGQGCGGGVWSLPGCPAGRSTVKSRRVADEAGASARLRAPNRGRGRRGPGPGWPSRCPAPIIRRANALGLRRPGTGRSTSSQNGSP